MNDLPPKIAANPPGASIAKPSTPLTKKHLVLGMVGGCIAGMVLATLFWVIVGVLVFRTAHVQPAQVQVDPLQAAEVRVEPLESSEVSSRATIAEIDAVAQLSFDNNKLSSFSQIAARPNLSPDAQVHLVEATLKHLSFENHQMQVLLKLIENPAFSPSAKERILKDLNRISFDNNKQALLDAMNRRESVK